MQKFFLLFFILSLLFEPTAFSQVKTIAGKVTSKESGMPLSKVRVALKGTAVSVFTDNSGNYKIDVKTAQPVLVYTYPGMITFEVNPDSSGIINVQLEPDRLNVEGYFGTAFGIEKERKMQGFSFQEIGGEELQKSAETNLLNSLSGKLSGGDIIRSSGVAGAASFITVRGIRSIGGNNQPLIVVDGVIFDNSQYYSGNPQQGTNNLLEGVGYSNRLIDLNPEDVENILVLKSGAASALYGLHSANGALLITTRNNNSGEYRKNNFSFHYTTSVSVEQVSKLPARQKSFAQGLNGTWLGPETGCRYSWGPAMDTCSYATAGLSPAQDVNADGVYDWNKYGVIVSKNDANANGQPVNAYDNLKDFFETGYTYYNAASLSGGNAGADFYASFSHRKTDGIIPGNHFSRTTFKISGQSRVSEKVIAAGSAGYVNSGGSRMQQGSSLSGIMLGLMRTPPSFDNSNGYDNPADHEESYRFTEGPSIGRQRSYCGYGVYDNPYWSVNMNRFKDDVNRFFGYVYLDYLPVEWLSISYRLGSDIYSDRRKSHFAVYSGQNEQGQVFEDQHFNRSINGDLLLGIKKKLSSDFRLDLTFGQNTYQVYHQQLYVQGDTLVQSGFYHLSNARSLMTTELQNKKRTSAVFCDLGITYRNMIYFNAMGRNEWSTTLPENKNSFFIPSFNMGFVFTEIQGLKNNKILPFGKLRAAYAITANDAFMYGVTNYYLSGINADGFTVGNAFPYGGNFSFVVDEVLTNRNIKPEKTYSFEAGTELRFFDNRMSLDFTYYLNRSKDIIIWAPYSDTSGYTQRLINSAEIENKGFEITAVFVPVKSKNHKVQWEIGINFSKNDNLVVSLAEGVEGISLCGFSNAEIRVEKGKPYGCIYGTRWLRNEEGKLIIDDDPLSAGYGYPLMAPDKTCLGTVQPDWLMGISNSLRIFNVSVSLLVDIKKGGMMWNGTRGIMYALGIHKDTENRGETLIFDGVKGHRDSYGNLITSSEANDIVAVKNENWYKHLGGGFEGPAEQFVEKTDWIRLREVYLAYTFNPNWFKNSFFKGINVFFSGRNLLLFTPYSGIDPETSLTGADNAQGIDYFNMPGIRTYTVGLRVQL